MSNSIKVLMIPYLPLSLVGGGQEVQTRFTMQELQKLGVEVRIIDYEDPNIFKWPDVIHIFDLNNYHVGLGIAAFTDKPIVLSSVFYEASFLKRKVIQAYQHLPKTLPAYYKKILKSSVFVLPNSQAEADQIQQIYGTNPGKFRVIPNGVDTSVPEGDAERFRSKYLSGWNYEDGIVLSAHRMERRKNTINLVKACRAGKIPLILAGARADNEYTREVMALVDSCPHILHVGQLNSQDLRDAFALAQVHALPSYMETPGLSSIEAGLAGCNLVVGSCPPVVEYFQKHAWICRQNPKAILFALEEARIQPRDSKGQKAFFRANFAWEIAARKTLDAYREALLCSR